MTKNYFALEETNKFIDECLGYNASWQNSVTAGNQGIAAVWFRNLSYYYGTVLNGVGYDTSLEFGGQEGELVKMLVPQARSLNQQFLSITTKQKLNFDPLADSSDAETLDATRLAKGVLSDCVSSQKMDLKGYRLGELATLTGVSYLWTNWDIMRGRPIGVGENDSIILSGQQVTEALLPTDVIFDCTREDFYDLDWVMIRSRKNKYDLMRSYPDLADKIDKLPTINKLGDNLMFFYNTHNDDSVFVYYVYHKTTPSLPNGRYAMFCDKDIAFTDGENPYKDPEGNAFIPVVQLKPEPIIATGWGYPMFSNILPTQEMMDMAFSAVASNQAAFAVQSILNPIGNDISVKNIGNLRFLNYRPQNVPGGGAPQSLQLTQSSPETYKFIDLLLNHMQMVYNINSAMRGQPPAGVTSGTAIATLTTNGVEFSQNFIKAYVDSLETWASYTIWNYACFSDEETLVNIVGPNNTATVKSFVGKDLKPIRRVRAKISNPLMSTAAGRLQIAENLLQQGMVQDPQTYFDVLEGAPVEVMTNTVRSEDSLIYKENDDLRDGKSVKALWYDTHDKHILHHKALTYDPDIRRNSAMLQNILAHIDEHDQLKMQMQGQPQGQGQPQEGAAPAPSGEQVEEGATAAEPAKSLSQLSAPPLQGPVTEGL